MINELRRQNWSISDEAIQRGLKNASIPGRLETVREKPWILLDGGHNPDAMQFVRNFLEKRLRGRCLTVLFGAMADKDLGGMLSVLAPITHEFVFTSVASRRAASAETLMKYARGFAQRCRAVSTAAEAFRLLLDELGTDEVLLVTGSFYLVGEVKKVSYKV